MGDAPDKPRAPRERGLLERLRAAGAEMDRFDDATLAATAAVHRALLAQPKTRYLGVVDPTDWGRLPVAVETVLGAWPGRIEQLCLVVPWTPAVMPSASDYLRAAKRALGRAGHKTVLLVTSHELAELEVDLLGRETGCLVTALVASDLRLVGPARARERIPDALGNLSSRDNSGVDVEAAIVAHNAELRQADRFHDALDAATPRTWAAPLILGINALVFTLMVAGGVSWWMPSTDSIFAWGGTYGPSVVRGEWWRLLTANYVHFGVLHAGFNMWCFWQVGRFTERLLGSWAFLLAYTLSGVAGSIASIGHNAQGVGAGASGAVFGVFGCILGFMLVRRRTVPVSVFKPLVLSVLGFLGYNLAYGLTQPHIDNSAHVGGLVAGFLCGIALSRRLPASKGGTPAVRYLYALGVALLVASGAAFVAGRVPKDAPRREVSAVAAYEAFAAVAAPLFEEFDHITAEISALRAKDPAAHLAELVERARSNATALARIPVTNREVAALRMLWRGAFGEQVLALDALAKAAQATDAAKAQDLARRWQVHLRRMTDKLEACRAAQAAFLERHGLKPAPTY